MAQNTDPRESRAQSETRVKLANNKVSRVTDGFGELFRVLIKIVLAVNPDT